ncbi:hypothetical protein [Streptococcus merionis]|uniref:hypothetical protein n=1 Tax=Streptococcus merionis TaxID=400065 RepID=UPI0035169798
MKEKLLSFWGKIGSQHRLLLGIIGAAVLVVLFLGFKDAGRVYYEGHYYEAGSLFMPDKYGSLSDYMWNGDGVKYVNQQVANLRYQSLFPIFISLAGAGFSGYRLYKDDSFMKELLDIL